MYAIIQTGGKQYRVEKGDVIEVERLGVENGAVDFKEVLFFSDGKAALVGTPHVKDCLVKGEVIGERKGPKVIAFKYKRRKNYRKKIGHRQKYDRVKIIDIVMEGGGA
jgi:large subunit ribosomal protein L21